MSEEFDNAAERAEVEAIFAQMHATGDDEVADSPCRRFRLTVTDYSRGPHSWDYSRGVLTRIADGAVVADIVRNYGNFHLSWIEAHGKWWLVTGRSYMSQTIVCLDDGREFEPPGDHYDGQAFCWASAWASPDGNTLVVDGCHWACPYEFRFFDFSDPAQGWAELPIVDELDGEPVDYLPVEGEAPPHWRSATEVECRYVGPDDELRARVTLRREGDQMRIIERWVSPAEAERRAEQARVEAERAALRARLERDDPTVLAMRNALARCTSLPADELRVSNNGLGEPVVWARFRREQPRCSADIEWKPGLGPIRLQRYDADGMRTTTDTFEATPSGGTAAIEAAAAIFER